VTGACEALNIVAIAFEIAFEFCEREIVGFERI